MIIFVCDFGIELFEDLHASFLGIKRIGFCMRGNDGISRDPLAQSKCPDVKSCFLLPGQFGHQAQHMCGLFFMIFDMSAVQPCLLREVHGRQWAA